MTGRVLAALLATGVAAAALSGCTSSSGGGQSVAAGAGCAPAKGAAVVSLTDPKAAVQPDQAIPAVSSKYAYQPVLDTVDKVSKALDQGTFLAANQALRSKKMQLGAVVQGFFTAKKIAIQKKYTGRLTLGVTKSPENQLVGQLYREALTRAGWTVTVTTLADDQAVIIALNKKQVHVAPQFTTSALAALVAVTRAKVTAPTSLQATIQALASAGLKAGIVYGPPAKASVQQVYAVSAALAKQKKLITLDDFAKACSGDKTVLGATEADAKGLAATYKIAVGSVTQMKDADEATAALKSGAATIVTVPATDPAFG